ncbi:CDP-diacylglycerol--glycerol-3-phosphate 3-phosphatidyltransferase [Halopelagius inordinatus]|uniref:CDP-diacylglycerol--glycerol-3-phosphate 3-phosphatidyltransferase n=1 Tax=Halopelagius inordinatus TaxID=553467 RepID=A0A1I2NST6_9EURY|nr:CDP-alcohol phosphatidyltransferase family protein [Halopelagius inordinatus]SFG04331.1 CDP-diacylglycerol--glycerol-3-phosphate 3-phosphatidyltransferase [Halopelagius inordinatus]
MSDADIAEENRRTETVPPRLVRRTRAVVALAFGLTALAATGVRTDAGDAVAGQWFAGASVGLAAVCWILVSNRAENRASPGDAVGSTLGPANAVTVGRGVLSAWVLGFAVVAVRPAEFDAWFPALAYGVAVVSDALDGAVARALNCETRLGERLDVEYDAFGLLAAATAGVVGGVVPWPYLAVGVARYAFVAARAVRRRRNRPVFDLPPRRSRRVLAGLQMAYVVVALAPPTPRVVAVTGAALCGLPLLLGFVRDWLLVTGRRTDARRRR